MANHDVDPEDLRAYLAELGKLREDISFVSLSFQLGPCMRANKYPLGCVTLPFFFIMFTGVYFTRAWPWAAVAIAVLVSGLWVGGLLWIRSRLAVRLLHCIPLPAVVVSLEPLQIAVLNNLSYWGGPPRYYIKVDWSDVPRHHFPGLRVGTRLPAVELFSFIETDACDGQPADFSPTLAHEYTLAPREIAAVQERISEQDYLNLEACLNQLPEFVKPGLYPISLPKDKEGA